MFEPSDIKKFYEDNKDNVFYYISSNSNSISEIKEVKPDRYSNMILWYYPKGNVDKKKITKFNACWDDIFETEEEAKTALEYYKYLFESFRHKPHLSIRMLVKHADELHKIEREIENGLKDSENFDGIDFCDVSANGIQVRIHHKKIKKYTYGKQYTILYDFSNAVDVSQFVIEHFKEIDNPTCIQETLRFIADGEKYGWD